MLPFTFGLSRQILLGLQRFIRAERHHYNEQDCTIDTFIVGPKGDFATIGDALAASGTGDTILVSPGIYYENIDYTGAGVTIRSTDGADVTILLMLEETFQLCECMVRQPIPQF